MNKAISKDEKPAIKDMDNAKYEGSSSKLIGGN